MEIKGIKYIGPHFDNSGYSKACRENIIALYKLGVPLTISPMSFEEARPDLGDAGEILYSLLNKNIDYNVVIIHSTPEFWDKHRESGKLNCGYTIWETTKLHPAWPDYINNNVDICFVGCEWNVEVFKNSGVKVPIYSVPHCISTDMVSNATSYNVSGVNESTYVFYSVLQWTERKSPTDTVKAYWRAFTENEDVALVLKTYRSNYSESEKEAIRMSIKRLKYLCPAKNYPPIYLILDMLTEEEMFGLHMRGDCFVSLDRGEGLGLGALQAGVVGNPIIVTGFGGVTEYAKQDNSYLVDYVLTPVSAMPWSPWYQLEQDWAQASPTHGAEIMNYVYKNQQEAKKKGLKLQRYINENMSPEVIGKKIIKSIEGFKKHE